MQKIWLDSYPETVPHEIIPDHYLSISDFFEKKVADYRDKIAYRNLGISMTYAELEIRSRHFSNFLLQDRRLAKGDRVGIMLPNLLQYPVVLFGILRAGLTVVNINPLYTPAELRPIIEDSDMQTIIVLEQFAHVVQTVSTFSPIKNIIVTELGDLFPVVKRMIASCYLKYIKRSIPTYHLPNAIKFKDALNLGENLLFTPHAIQSEDLAFLQYTGGTTGKPKGVMLTHRNILANIEQAIAWVSPTLSPGKEIFITALPLYHVFSLMANAFVPLYIGALNILITNPRDIKRFLEEIATSNFTVITGVNTLYKNMMNHPYFIKYVNCKSLKMALSGGMALQKEIADKWLKLTKIPLLEAYGLTETSPGISMFPVTSTTAHNGSAGLPWPSTDIDIRDHANQSVGFNEIGEVWVKGPQVMKGYWKNSKATQSVLTKTGWLDTGDIGKVDEQGFLSIIERKKDMIIVSGFNVYPIEVETVIASHPDVQEVAVLGIKEADGQEIIKACIIKNTSSLTRDQIIKHCQAYLTHYKVPKTIEFVDNIPKSPIGKVLKKDLRGY